MEASYLNHFVIELLFSTYLQDNKAKTVQPAKAAVPKKKEESSESSESDSDSDSDEVGIPVFSLV